MLSLRDRSRTYRSPKKFGEAMPMTPIFDLNFKYFTCRPVHMLNFDEIQCRVILHVTLIKSNMKWIQFDFYALMT